MSRKLLNFFTVLIVLKFQYGFAESACAGSLSQIVDLNSYREKKEMQKPASFKEALKILSQSILNLEKSHAAFNFNNFIQNNYYLAAFLKKEFMSAHDLFLKSLNENKSPINVPTIRDYVLYSGLLSGQSPEEIAILILNNLNFSSDLVDEREILKLIQFQFPVTYQSFFTRGRDISGLDYRINQFAKHNLSKAIKLIAHINQSSTPEQFKTNLLHGVTHKTLLTGLAQQKMDAIYKSSLAKAMTNFEHFNGDLAFLQAVMSYQDKKLNNPLDLFTHYLPIKARVDRIVSFFQYKIEALYEALDLLTRSLYDMINEQQKLEFQPHKSQYGIKIKKITDELLKQPKYSQIATFMSSTHPFYLLDFFEKIDTSRMTKDERHILSEFYQDYVNQTESTFAQYIVDYIEQTNRIESLENFIEQLSQKVIDLEKKNPALSLNLIRF